MNTIESLADEAALDALRQAAPGLLAVLIELVQRGQSDRQILSACERAGASPAVLLYVGGGLVAWRATRAAAAS